MKGQGHVGFCAHDTAATCG